MILVPTLREHKMQMITYQVLSHSVRGKTADSSLLLSATDYKQYWLEIRSKI